MAVAFDKATKSGAVNNWTAAAKTQSHTHTPIGTPKAAMVVAHVSGASTSSTYSHLTSVAATYGGTAMTEQGHVAQHNAGTESTEAGYMIYFTLKDPPTGAQTASVSLTRDNTTGTPTLTVLSVTYTGSTNVIWRGTDHSTSNTDASTIAFTSNSGSTMVMLDVQYENVGNDPSPTIRYGPQDLGSTGLDPGFSYAYVVDKTAAGVSTTFTWTSNAAPPWGVGVVELTAFETVARNAALAGAGVLSATVQIKVPATATLAGTGTLSATLTSLQARNGALSGLGELLADAVIYVPEVAGAFSGEGQLSAVIQSLRPNLTGHGRLAATALVTATSSATTLRGQGRLAATVATAKPAAVGWWAVNF